MDEIEEKLTEMGLALPEPWTPRGNFLGYRSSGRMVFFSGQICEWRGDVICHGPVGENCTLEEARKAAEVCALNLLYHLRAACDGDFARVSSILRVGGFVNCGDNFMDSPVVLNGASDLFLKLFGESGRHARTAVGVRGLPGGAAVEVDMIVELKDN